MNDPRLPHGESGFFQHEPGAPCVVCDRHGRQTPDVLTPVVIEGMTYLADKHTETDLRRIAVPDLGDVEMRPGRAPDTQPRTR